MENRGEKGFSSLRHMYTILPTYRQLKGMIGSGILSFFEVLKIYDSRYDAIRSFMMINLL